MLRLPSLIALCTSLAAFGCGENGRSSSGGGGGDASLGGFPDGGRAGTDSGGADAGPAMGDAGPGGGDATAGGDVDAGPAGACPPTGPYGTSPGQVVPDVTLYDCEGTPHTLHELCGHRVSWVFEFTDWCPPCRSFAEGADDIYTRFAGDDLGAFFVISENASFGPPTAELCAEVRERYGLTMTVLYDPDGSFAETLGVPTNDFHVVMTRGNVVSWTGHYDDSMVESRIEAAFAATE